MANVPIRHRMRRSLNLDTFTDEIHTDVGSAAFVLSELVEATGHDYFSQQDLVIRTASGGGGTLLVENTHYTLDDENTEYSTLATNAAGSTKNIYKTIQITDAAYQSGALYFSGKYFTDYLDPYDLNNITPRIEAKNAVFTIDELPGFHIYAVTTGAGSFAGTLCDCANNGDVEGLIYKADTGAGICTVTPAGADTLLGASAFPLRKKGDFIRYKSVNGSTDWYVMDSLATIDSSTLAVSTKQTLAHGCGVMPRSCNAYLVNSSTEANYAANDELPIASVWDQTNRRLIDIVKDATNFCILTDINVLLLADKNTTVQAALTMNKWYVRIRYKL